MIKEDLLYVVKRNVIFILKHILKIMLILMLHVPVLEQIQLGINLIIINGLKIKQLIKFIC